MPSIVFFAASVMCAAGLVLSYVYPQYFAGFGNENFQTEFFILLLPFLFFGIRKSIIGALCALMFFGAAYMVFFGPSHQRWLILAGLAFVGLTYLWLWGFRWASLIVAFSGLNVGLYAGFLSRNFLESIYTRIELTANTLAMWLSAPFFGKGLGSFNVEYPNFQEAHFSWFPWIGTAFDKDMMYYAGAAHNEYAQLLSDYGLAGFILACLFAWFLVGKPRDRLDWAAYGCLYFVGLISLVEFPLQNPHTGLIAAVSAGLVASGRRTVAFEWSRLPALTIATCAAKAVVIVFVGYVAVNSWRAYSHFSYTQTLLGSNTLEAVKRNFDAYNTFSWPRNVRHQLGLTVASGLVKMEDRLEIKPKAADQVHAIARKAGGRATAIEVARIEYLIHSGRGEEKFEEIEDSLAWLREKAAHHNATWIMEAKWSLLTRNADRLVHAYQKAQSMPRTLPSYMEHINTMIAAIK